MSELETSVLVFVLLLAFTAAGTAIRPWLPDEHKSEETVRLVQLAVGMLVTFAALVLGLLTASAKTVFDTTSADIRTYAAQLVQLDDSLREYGTDASPTHTLLRAYTGAAIASTWPAETPPAGDFYPVVPPSGAGQDTHLDSRPLGAMLETAQRQAREWQPRDAFHQRLAATTLDQFNQLIKQRWKIVEEARGSVSSPFDKILVVWLLIIFLCLGLISPRNALSLVVMSLAAFSIASAVFVILDLDTPFTGTILVSSQPMRDALTYLSR